MATGQLSGVLRHLRRAALLHDGGMTDGQLLESFITRRDEAAFEALLRRHGPMVWAVCRRVLHNPHDAEDAFQATFLVLVRKAACIGQKELVGNWLYGAAYRAALEAKAVRRRARERPVSTMPEPEAPMTDVWEDLRPLLDQELSRLPDKYQVPVVFCDLEGRPRREVARQLGIPEGTLSSRLATARRMLAKRLARRGLVLSGAALAAALSQQAASACVPSPLAVSTVKTATLVVAGQAATAVIPARVAAVMEGVVKAMLLTRLHSVTVLALVAGALLVFGAVTYHALAAGQAGAKQGDAPKPPDAAEKVGEVRRFEGHGGTISRVTFSPDGRLAASSSLANTVRLWDVATGKLLQVLEGHTDRVECVTFSPDGKRVLSAAWDATVRLWDTESGKELKRLDSQAAPGVHVCNVIFFKEGKKFLWNAADHHSLQVWDVETGQMLKEFAEHPDHVVAVALSPDGKRVLEGNWDSNLRLWDIESGQELRQFQGHTGRVYCVAISPDGKLGLSVSGEDKEVFLWDLETGKEVRRFAGHTAPVDFVAFSPDGRRALSGGQDKTVRLWEVNTGKELHQFEGHTDRVQCVAFSPDGRYALSGSDDRTVRLWRLPK